MVKNMEMKKTRETKNLKALQIAVAAQILWGLLPIYWKWLHELPSYQILVHRILWSMVFLHILLTVTRKRGYIKNLLQNPRHYRTSILGGLLVSFNWFIYIWSVNTGEILQASLGYYTMPLMTALFGIFLGESLNPRQWMAFAFAAAGVAVQMVALGTFPFISLALALSFSLYTVVKRQSPLESLDSLYTETLFVAPIALLYLIYAELTGAGITGNLPPAYWLRIFTTGMVTAIPLLLYGYGVRKVPLRVTAFIQYLNPTIALLVGVLLYHESFSPLRFFSFLLIWIAILIFTLDQIQVYRLSRG